MNSATIHIYPPNVLYYSGQTVDLSEKQASLLPLLPLELEEILHNASSYQSSISEMLQEVSALK